MAQEAPSASATPAACGGRISGTLGAFGHKIYPFATVAGDVYDFQATSSGALVLIAEPGAGGGRLRGDHLGARGDNPERGAGLNGNSLLPTQVDVDGD